jgi:hypothetical protein
VPRLEILRPGPGIAPRGSWRSSRMLRRTRWSTGCTPFCATSVGQNAVQRADSYSGGLAPSGTGRVLAFIGGDADLAPDLHPEVGGVRRLPAVRDASARWAKVCRGVKQACRMTESAELRFRSFCTDSGRRRARGRRRVPAARQATNPRWRWVATPPSDPASCATAWRPLSGTAALEVDASTDPRVDRSEGVAGGSRTGVHSAGSQPSYRLDLR